MRANGRQIGRRFLSGDQGSCRWWYDDDHRLRHPQEGRIPFGGVREVPRVRRSESLLRLFAPRRCHVLESKSEPLNRSTSVQDSL